MSEEQPLPESHTPEAQAPEAQTEGAPEVAPPTAVVGIGGSAGALDGYERFFLSLPPDSGMAFVVVPHLDPKHSGLMPEILQRCTDMPVVLIEDGMRVYADQVHVIPPNRSLSLMNGTLLLDDLERANGMVIDAFFESLAADQGERAVGVVLSGMGGDGTRGVQAIKEHFGLVLVQDPETAEYPSMPRSAAATQLANDVLPAEDLAPRLYGFVTRRKPLAEEDVAGQDGQANAPLQKILRLVRVRTGHDFSRYKRNTLVRRIDRRMKGQRVEDVAEYVRLLQDRPDEVEALFQDLTINVTSFFRDVDAFEELKDQLRAYILKHKQDMDTFRAWVAGCSTGEEAYSVAMVLHELLADLKDERALKVQIFATDIDKEAVDKARYGLYPRDITYVVSPERLTRFFTLRDGGYQVRPEIRDTVVFASHNTFGDPPFTRLDLLCCRNLLIYLGAELQKQVMTLFHYALRPGGLLFLGASETVGGDRERFSVLSPRWKIYRRGDGPAGPLPLGNSLGPSGVVASAGLTGFAPPARSADVSSQAQQVLLSEYAPPAVVVDERGDIVYVNGRTARYLEFPSGKTATSVFDMVQGDLRYTLPAAVRQAGAERHEVRREGLHVELDGAPQLLDLSVRPLQGPHAGLLLIVFQERPDGGDGGAPLGSSEQVVALERELRHSRESLQANVEEMAVSMEELKSTNEELQTTNEELQSSNEELTTSKEELQSLNEELITINAEHQRVIVDLAQANDDMKNLLDSAGIATVFLGNDLRIKRFTPRITQVINLMPVDVGRPLSDLSVNLRYDHLTADITRVLETLETFETQVQTVEGQWYLMRVSPYRTSDNFIDGVVVALTNIDLVKSLERQLRESRTYAEAVLDSLQDAVLVLDGHLRVVTANRALHDLLGTSGPQVRGERLYDIGGFAFDQPELQTRLRDVVATEQPLSAYVIDLTVPGGATRKMKTEAEPLISDDGESALFLFKLEDVTELLKRAANEGADIRGDAAGEG